MQKSTGILIGALCFFAGVVCGFIFSPVQKGVYIGNNSGNNCGSNHRFSPLNKKDAEKI